MKTIYFVFQILIIRYNSMEMIIPTIQQYTVLAIYAWSYMCIYVSINGRGNHSFNVYVGERDHQLLPLFDSMEEKLQ